MQRQIFQGPGLCVCTALTASSKDMSIGRSQGLFTELMAFCNFLTLA